MGPSCNVRYPSFIGDGKCNVGYYNTEECGWDGGDCDEFNEKPFYENYPDCIVEEENVPIGTGSCYGGEYNTEECGWEGGDCVEFNEKLNEQYPGCKVQIPQYIGDGHCRGVYNTEECGWDGGDCVEFNAKYPDCKVQSPHWIGDGH